MQYLGAISKKKNNNNNCSLFPRQTVQHHTYLKPMPQPLMPKKRNSSMKQNCCSSQTTPSRTNTKKRRPFHHRGLEYKVGSQETPRITGKFSLRVENEGQRLTEFYQENMLVIANTVFQNFKRQIYTRTSV